MLFFAAAQVVAFGLIFIVAELVMGGVRLSLRGAVRDAPSKIVRAASPVPGWEDRVLSISVVGDSHTYGKGAPRGLSYPDQLAALINQTGRVGGTNIVNLSFPGMNSNEASAKFLEHARGGGSSLAVICIGNNNKHNLNLTGFLPDEIAGLPVKERLYHLLEHSGTYRLSKIARSRIRQAMDEDGSKVYLHDAYWRDCVLCEEDEPFLRSWLRHDLDLMILAARARGIRVVLLSYYYAQAYIDDTMADLAAQYRIPFVDVRRFGLPPGRDIVPLLGDPSHPNAEGYGIIARKVFDTLMKNDLVPPPGPRGVAGQ
ncbi:MAG: GDSL-type esterase/lipase family protein [Deltaproteobacteria bacterium]|nr:GDSL-type esterase/lipase family protein [Deltaproteobacteria bacterium]